MKRKSYILISRAREERTSWRRLLSRIDNKKIISTGFTSRHPFTLEVLNFSQQRPISSVSPQKLPEGRKEGGRGEAAARGW